jgi:hypothetical protein
MYKLRLELPLLLLTVVVLAVDGNKIYGNAFSCIKLITVINTFVFLFYLFDG